MYICTLCAFTFFHDFRPCDPKDSHRIIPDNWDRFLLPNISVYNDGEGCLPLNRGSKCVGYNFHTCRVRYPVPNPKVADGNFKASEIVCILPPKLSYKMVIVTYF